MRNDRGRQPGLRLHPMMGLTDLEHVSGVVSGRVSWSAARSAAAAGESPLHALERSVLPALRRPPCLVSFSGGLDSSFVLAVAARVARRHGLPPPIPCTWRFTDAPRADESAWQDRVLEALQLPDWVVLHAEDDLDLVGPVAQRALIQHGALYPNNLHLHLPIVERVAGGSLLTGAGGDQILSGWRRVSQQGLRSRFREAVPSAARTRVQQHRGDDMFPWLTRAASRRVVSSLLRERAAEPRRFHRRVVWHATRRDLTSTVAGLEMVGAGSDVLVVSPLIDAGFVTALARTGRHRNAQLPRADLLTELAADALPAVITAPRPKAHFLEVFFRSPTRELVSNWDGHGVDPRLVDVDALREAWSHWPIPAGTAPLVQQVWLAAHPTTPEPATVLKGPAT